MSTIISREEFHLKEYECLRRGVDSLQKDTRSLERNVVIAVGITWGYLYDKHTDWWTYLFPVIFGGLGWVRSRGFHKALDKFHTYLKEIETAFGPTDKPQGWEHFRDGYGDSTDQLEGGVMFWICLESATFGVLLMRFFKVF
jgi:hypothetical protein